MPDVDAELAALIEESLGDDAVAAPDDNSLISLRQVALQLRELRDRKTGVDAESKAIAEQIKAVEQDVKNRMDALGSSSLRIEGVGLLYLQTDPYPVVHDPEAFIQWADANGLSFLAKRSIHASTARAFWKERLASGEALPPDEIADATLIKTVRMRK